jgi:predicted transcriptional regulator
MPTLTLTIDEDLSAALEAVAIRQGRDKTDLAVEALRRYVDLVRRVRSSHTPDRARLYLQAEAGLADYAAEMEEPDGNAPL